ncbi:helix-turn-helix domain-containing protein [Chryseobacterium pennipullorum]|uniref:Helix-turn-helix domain-containing protein n=1 Tax=Chryseobacterium pennipullorum TaxID=2258963 RepID=A0A3D9B5Q0_9FLAO|nr:helix-turn-helix domain-containing protein [Chryseobacterium pennipullorum]REC49010.1 helix-turn-helix domain-containing protein [Chryseobacterium pennipullorum]
METRECIKVDGPDYKKIYTDIILMKFPDKFEICHSILNKENLTVLDVIELNQIVFQLKNIETEQFNQRHKSYDTQTIIKILEFQKKNGYNNTQTANRFKTSRNTLAKWKKIFQH